MKAKPLTLNSPELEGTSAREWHHRTTVSEESPILEAHVGLEPKAAVNAFPLAHLRSVDEQS